MRCAVCEGGDPRAEDRELMDWAWSNGYVVLQIRTQDLRPAAIGGTVVRVLTEHRAALLKGAILTVDERGSRVRVLPLESSLT